MTSQKLRTLILRNLTLKEQSGYSLRKAIQETTGWTPSYGSIYPELELLKQEELATSREEGKRKIYTLTQKGKEESKKLKADPAILERLKEDMKIMSCLMGVKEEQHEELMNMLFSAVARGENPMAPVNNSIIKLKMTLGRLYAKNAIKKEQKKINNALEEAIHKLERIEKTY